MLVLQMNKKKKLFEKRPLIPGFEAGLYEKQPEYNKEELAESLGAIMSTSGFLMLICPNCRNFPSGKVFLSNQ